MNQTEDIVESRLSFFLERGAHFHGVIHVGSNDGAEIAWYRQAGCKPILCFEPHPDALARAAARWKGTKDVLFAPVALGEENGRLEFWVPADGDDEKTSRYRPIPTPGHDWTTVPAGHSISVPVMRFDSWAMTARPGLGCYNTLVVDVQGMELEVLRGFGTCLNYLDYLCIELSAAPVYEGEAPAARVIEYLDGWGFHPLTEVQEHDDVLFSRKRS